MQCGSKQEIETIAIVRYKSTVSTKIKPLQNIINFTNAGIPARCNKRAMWLI